MSDGFDDALNVPVSTDGMNEDDAKPSAGNLVQKEGRYHVVCNEVSKPETKGTPYIQLNLEIYGGTEEDQVGKYIFHKVYLAKRQGEGDNVTFGPLSEGGIRNMCRVANAFGLIEPSQMGGDIVIPWGSAPTRQAIVKVAADKYIDKNSGAEKTSYGIPFGDAWRLDDEEVASVPRDGEAVSLAPPPLTPGEAPDAGVDVDDL